VQGLFEKDEGDSIGVKLEQLIFHDVAGNDNVFHKSTISVSVIRVRPG
jgi:hypothetical protein